jgi:Arc/MetJ family transcription regulator
VYGGVVARTNIEIDQELVERVMRLYDLRTKREAVDFALRQLDIQPMSKEDALGMQGSGWEGSLEQLRSPDDVTEL